MSRSRLFITGVLLFCLSLVVWADEIDEYVKTEMQKRHIPGLSLAVVKDGKVMKAQGYGFANVELQVPASAHTVYEIGSISKQFTATVLMMLVEEGKINVQDKITRCLTSLPSTWREVTIRHLLTHTSGIPDFEAVIGYDSYRNLYTDETLLKTVSERPMDFQPGEKWNYSNTGYYLLAMILEKVTGKPYHQLIQERIFLSLGMSESRDSEPKVLIPNRAAGYDWDAGTLQNRDPMQPTACKGAGTLVSTVLDLAIWDSVLYTEKLLKQSSLEEMWTPVSLNDGTTIPYGFGWGLRPWHGHKRISHDGGTAGFTTIMSRFINDHLTVIVLTNLYYVSWDYDIIIDKIAKTIAGFYIPDLAPPVYKPIADVEPEVTALVRSFYEALIESDEKWNPSLFTDEFWAILKPFLIQNNEYFKKLGVVNSVTLVERTNDGENKLYRYRIAYKERSRLVLVTINKDGKISAFRVEEE